MATESRSRFNKVIVPGLFAMMTEEYKRYNEDWRKFYTVKKSSRAYEEVAYMSSLGRAIAKPEGTPIFYDARIQGPSKKFVHETFGLGLRITEEAIEDDLYDVIESGAKELSASMAESINVEAFRPLNERTAFTSADGHYIYDNNHEYLGGGTWSNYYTATSLSLDAIQDDIKAYESITDHRGKLINRAGSCNLIVANPALEWKLAEIIGTQMNPDTANNTVNSLTKQRPRLTFFCTPYVTSTTARYYFGEKDQVRGLLWFTRKPPTFAGDGDFDTGDALFKVTARFSRGCADPMNIAMNPGA